MFFLSKFKKISLILLGNLTYALAVSYFILPLGLITGGTTGIGLFIGYLFPIKVSRFVLIYNVIMFLIGLIVLGKRFALSTLISTLAYPLMLDLGEWLFGITGPLTEDLMLSTIFAGAMIGAGIGLVIRAGASTGGMDIPPLVLNKKLGISVSVSLYVFDILILLLQAVFSNKEQIMFGILLVCIYTYVLNKVLILGNSKIMLQIISRNYADINEMIATRFDRGATLYEVEGGYTRCETYAVHSVINQRELFAVKEAVMQLDPAAFIIISEVNEVKGRGFSLNKVYEPKKTDNLSSNSL